MPNAPLSRLIAARKNLENAVENALWDLGEVGKAKAADILSEIQDELDEIENLIEEGDDA